MHWLLAIMIGGFIVRASVQEGWWGFRWMCVTQAILIISILFHELAHCWMATRVGGSAESILLWPLGGLAQVQHSRSPGDTIRVSGIGPVSTFVLGVICAGVFLLTLHRAPWRWSYLSPFENWWYTDLSTAQNFLLHAVRLNLILGLFNLCVPAYPLDGGAVLFAFLEIRYGRVRGAEVTTLVSIPIGIVLGVWGIAQNELMLILLGAWVLIEAFQMRHLIKIGEMEAHPAFGGRPSEFDYMPEPERKPGFFERWRRRRAEKRGRREAEKNARLQGDVDTVLEKVSREGIGSLTPAEREILDRASRRSRNDD